MSQNELKCDKCKSYLIKFPCYSVCPKCENKQIHILAKYYADLQMKKGEKDNG